MQQISFSTLGNVKVITMVRHAPDIRNKHTHTRIQTNTPTHSPIVDEIEIATADLDDSS